MDKKDKGLFNFRLLKRVFQYVKPYKNLFYASIIFSILIACFAPLRPFLIQLTINKVANPAAILPDWLNFFLSKKIENSLLQFLIYITVFQIILLLVETLVRFLFSFCTTRLGQNVVCDLRVNTFKKILNLNLKQFDNTPIGTFTTRTINDLESINSIFSDGFIPIIADVLTILITLCTMLWIDWRLTLIVLIPFPFMIVATYYFKESVKKSFTTVRNTVAQLNSFVQEHLTGMFITQAFAAEEREFKKFDTINQAHRNAHIKGIMAYSLFFPVVELVLAISTGLLVWWVAGEQLAPGLLVAFILYLNQIFRPLRMLADKFNVLQMGMIAAERVFKVLDNKDILKQPENPYIPANQSIKGKIEYKNVSFEYNKDEPVLQDINFTIQAGETVALVGNTGSGKSTIIGLLNRLYDASKGEILIDEKNIQRYDIAFLRSKIGVVLQDVFLFSGSVLENITLRNPKISFEQVQNAAQLLGVDEFIQKLPGAYHYKVLERGNTLSLGQRQLISFIRTLLYNPAILVLDEATSSIDTESELLIQKAIDTLIKGRTSIVIAHRLSTIRKAHKIIVLEKGNIIESGTHQDLLLEEGKYASLYYKQFEKEEKVLG